MKKPVLRYFILYMVLGALIGSLIGELAGWMLPDGVVKEFFIRSINPGFSIDSLNLIIMTFNLGIQFKLNISGLLGIFISVYLLKWYRY